MGRHGTPQPEPVSPVRRLWRRLPERWRARVWERRQRWRSWQDRRHTPAGEWDAALPKDPSGWNDHLDWGSHGVAAALRTYRRNRGDLLPEHRRPRERTS